MKYRKVSPDIEAIQWTGDNYSDVLEFGLPLWGDDMKINKDTQTVIILGRLFAHPGDYIIRHSWGELGVVNRGHFELHYEQV